MSNLGLFNWLNKPRIGTKINKLHPLAKGLVGFWAYNEGVGGPTEILSNNPAVSNTLSWTSYLSGRNLVLTGAGTQYFYTNVPNGSPLDVTGNSISFGSWFWSNSTANYQSIFAKQHPTTKDARHYSLYTAPGNTTQFYVQINGVAGFGASQSFDLQTSSVGWNTGAWNLILITYDGSAVRCYVNGKLGASTGTSGAISTIAGSQIYCGYDTAYANFGLIGSIDMSMVWNRALSPKEIYNLWISPNSIWQIFEPQIDQAILYRYLISKGVTPSIARVLLSSYSCGLTRPGLSLGLPLMRQ